MVGGYIVLKEDFLAKALMAALSGNSVEYEGAYDYISNVVDTGKEVRFPYARATSGFVSSQHSIFVTAEGDTFFFMYGNTTLTISKEAPNTISVEEV